MPILVRVLAAVIALLVTAGASRLEAQQRPLVTEDPETVGTGRVLVEAGFVHLRGVEYPVYGLEGNRLHLPALGVSIGLGSIVELQIDGGRSRFAITGRRPGPLSRSVALAGDSVSDADDVVVATKIRMVQETLGRPGIGVRLATKLPIASNETGLGTDMTDFSATLLVAKTVESVRIVGNIGVALIGNPAEFAAQNDPLVYSLSMARAVLPGFEVVGELEGRWLASSPDAPGAENRGAIRAGVRQTWGTVRLDAAAIVGLTTYEPSFGVTAGLTWVFDAFGRP